MPALDMRYMSPHAQDGLRLRVIRAVRAGMSQAEASRVFGVSRQSVNTWDKNQRTKGITALRAQPRGRPRILHLKPYQAATIARLIADRCPDQLKLPFMLWTREAVQELIRKRFGIQLSVWTVVRYLTRWGFTPQKPLRQAYEQDPAAVRRWLKREYPAIRALAHREKATVFWGDETSMRSDHQTGTFYGKRGHTPVIPGTGKRFRCNMLSAIANRGELAFMVFKGGFTTCVFLDFLKRLSRQHPRKVFLIIDRHPVHLSQKVIRWIKHTRKIRVYLLPGYSPQLNPDELLNQDVKANAVGRKRPRTQAELVSNVRRFLRSAQHRPKKVQSYFRGSHVRYAA
ncbi:MAG: IS630 family transposase [Candidatus Omnitrophota bacterium]|jgi:transposase